MKCPATERSSFIPLTFSCVSAVIAALVPSGQAQVANIEPAPQSVFDQEREESLAKFLSAGPFSIRPHLFMTAYYDDNLALTPHNGQEDLVWRFSPGVLFGLGEFRGEKGNYLSLDYTPTGSLYTKYSDYNSLDHHVIFETGWKLSKLTLGLSQSYEIANGKLVEASSFVEQESFITLLTSKYDLSDKTSFELNGRQALVSTEAQDINGPDEELTTINEWVLEAWGDYKTTEKLTLGLGATFGWRDIATHTGVDVDGVVDSPNQTFQQGLLRALYHATEKLDVRGSLGAQFSQFQDGEDDGPSLVFSLGASWQALERTSVAVDAYRHDRPSYTLVGRNLTTTGLRASVRQNFLEKYVAALAFGYENTDYTNVSEQRDVPDRMDNYFWVRPTLDYQFDERWTMGVFYQFRTKSSDVPAADFGSDAFDYSNNQVGIYSNYRF